MRAVDGSSITLNYSVEIAKKFPRAINQGSLAHYPKARMVVATNIITKQPVACTLGPFPGSERDLLKDLVAHNFKPGDISIIDRGLEGRKVWAQFEKHEQFFINRVQNPNKDAKRHYVNELLRSGKKEAIVEMNHEGKLLKVRLIRGKRLKWGYLVIVTNLLNRKKYRRRDILDLYGERQVVENTFLFSKPKMRLEKFRSKKLNGIMQEIFCNLFYISLVFGFIHLSNRRPARIVSFKWAGHLLKEHLFSILNLGISEELAEFLLQEIALFSEPKREERSYPRESKQPINPWPMARRPGGWRHRKEGWHERKTS